MGPSAVTMIAPTFGVEPSANPNALAAAIHCPAFPFQGTYRRLATQYVQKPKAKWFGQRPAGAAPVAIATAIRCAWPWRVDTILAAASRAALLLDSTTVAWSRVCWSRRWS